MQISFSQFKKETHHKRVHFRAENFKFHKIWEKTMDKFYCNSYSKDQLSCPSYLMTKPTTVLKESETVYRLGTDLSVTTVTILEAAN
jgi:hypothetical protein